MQASLAIFSVRPAREVNFVRFAMLKNIVGFVIIRQNALIPRSLRRYAAPGVGETFRTVGLFCSHLLTKQLFLADTPHSGASALFFRDALSHLKAISDAAARRSRTKRVGLKKYAALKI